MYASTVPMDSSKLVLLLSLLYILLFQPSLSAAQPNFNRYNCNYNNVNNDTTSSTYQRNINSLLSSLASDTQIDYGFYNLSVGEFPDRVNAIALCRGDIAVDVCRSCVNDSTRKIVEALQTLFARLQARAASGNSLKKFASGNQGAGDETVYAIVQCTPDLSEGQCSTCLLKLFSMIRSCCNGNIKGRIGARLSVPSCNLRWELRKFFNGTLEILPPPPPPQILSPTSPPEPSQGMKSNTAARIIVITVILAVGVMVLVICICLFIRKRMQREKERVEIEDEIESAESLQFTLSTIRDATEDFSEKNMLGQGGFGAVYKAWRNWREGTAQDIIDPVLSSGSTTEMMRCIHIGLLCVQENVADRPTMASVVLMLSSSSLTLQIPSQPAFLMTSRTYQSDISSSLGQNSRVTGQSSLSESEHFHLSKNEVSISEFYPR
ncbi:CYSTEINE-RICH RECEPTOR-KINASE-LIKE PROTEIN [Salix koriyanagi]|uniref:CYSTEINE-RICH RECEPTOR-KINASE-LIKE PROTEIN n=1 Tax=Salix koriyanagi TaxID=2511006 RepID=A0A9Q0ZBU0_9ROSI|nr:CYSTEINE-RICH RECEPTOR-KINASE-LIKE PROTEIN [Salix koriyanagi]